jgi:DAK2 domain fusion protein YloV
MSAVPALDRLTAPDLRRTVSTYRDVMKTHAAAINRLNVYPVPDGDTGTNMARTLDAVVAELDQAPDDLAATCAAISHGSLMGARGNSGVILSQILRGISATIRDGEVPAGSAPGADGAGLASALEAAAAAAYQAVLKPIEGTILTVVRESAAGATAAARLGRSLVEVLRAARDAGRTALAATPDMLPVLKDAGVVDAGGAGFLLFLDSALHVVDGEALPEPDETAGPTAEQLDAVAHRSGGGSELDVSEQRYEVMYFLDLADERIGEFKSGWGEIGDSIVVVGGDGLWNCHVHTNDIGASIEVALELGGRPRVIRVTDLFEEVAEEHAHREHGLRSAMEADRPHGHANAVASSSLPPVTCAVVAVASGEGLVELFGALGVQGVVSGGQTLNPSTAELLDAVEAVNSRQVVVLPNNKNIIPVAEQLGALTDKTVVVVPTTSMPAALASLVVYDPEADAETNAQEMAGAAASVATGEVTQAVRDSSSDAGPISAGDWIGIVRGDGIVAVSGSLLGAATTLLDHLVTPGREIVTVVAGLDADAGLTESLRGWLAEHHPDLEVEVHQGRQPLYPYLFGVE